MILSVGYRTNSNNATEFRKWATQELSKYTKERYVLDKERLINGKLFDDDYFEKLIEEIQDKIYKSDFDKLLEECEKQEIIKTNRDGDE